LLLVFLGGVFMYAAFVVAGFVVAGFVTAGGFSVPGFAVAAIVVFRLGIIDSRRACGISGGTDSSADSVSPTFLSS
jgi:hypothetical protein